MNHRSTSTLRKRLIPILGMLAVAGLYSIARAQAGAGPDADPSSTQEGMSLMAYWTDCQEFQYFLGFTLLVGLLFVGWSALTHTRQSAQEGQLLDSIDSDTSTMKDLVERAKTMRNNLFSRMIILVDKSIRHHQQERLDSLLESYRSNEENAMRNFSRWMIFFSSTAGALGLLGTVHGIYITFKRGQFSQEEALMGMSTALATTFVGLVISLILDLSASWVNTMKEKRITRNLSKADELKIIAFEAAVKRD